MRGANGLQSARVTRRSGSAQHSPKAEKGTIDAREQTGCISVGQTLVRMTAAGFCAG